MQLINSTVIREHSTIIFFYRSLYPGPISEGLVSRSLYLGAFIRELIYPGAYIRGAYIRGAYIRGLISGGGLMYGFICGLLSGGLRSRGLEVHTDTF